MKNSLNLVCNKKNQCPNCLKDISIPNFNKHYEYCIQLKPINISQYWDGVGYKCNICNKYYSKYGIKQHIKFGHNSSAEEKGEYYNIHFGKRILKSWNKGLTKETDVRVKKIGEKVSKTIQQQIKDGTYIARKMGEESRNKLSIEQSLKNRGGKSKWFEINGQKVQGTYELFFARKLEEQSIKWERIKTNNHVFKYVLDNKIKSYTPDFYLPDLDLYIEIKGYWWGNDENKMLALKDQHKDKNVIVLFGLQKIKDICINIKTSLLKEPIWSW